jgi:hypothetical protein
MIANGSDFIGFLCTGQLRIKNLRVLASGAPFKTGVAVVSAALSVCVPEVSCESAGASQVVKIRHK